MALTRSQSSTLFVQISWRQIPFKLFDNNVISPDPNCKRLFHYLIFIVLFKSLNPIGLYDSTSTKIVTKTLHEYKE